MWCASGIPKGGSHGGRRGGKGSSAAQPLPGCTALLDDQSCLPVIRGAGNLGDQGGAKHKQRCLSEKRSLLSDVQQIRRTKAIAVAFPSSCKESHFGHFCLAKLGNPHLAKTTSGSSLCPSMLLQP